MDQKIAIEALHGPILCIFVNLTLDCKCFSDQEYPVYSADLSVCGHPSLYLLYLWIRSIPRYE